MNVVLALLASLMAHAAWAQVSAPPVQAPNSRIQGRVTDSDGGSPIADVIVRLFNPATSETFTTRTDEAGRYRFDGLMPGEYTGFVEPPVERPSHLSTPFRGSAAPRSRVVLRPGETREVTVSLRRAAALNVRVVDESGEPLSGVGITLKSADTGRLAAGSLHRQTDDKGRIRLFRLEPGRYVVCAEVSHARPALPAAAPLDCARATHPPRQRTRRNPYRLTVLTAPTSRSGCAAADSSLVIFNDRSRLASLAETAERITVSGEEERAVDLRLQTARR